MNAIDAEWAIHCADRPAPNCLLVRPEGSGHIATQACTVIQGAGFGFRDVEARIVRRTDFSFDDRLDRFRFML